MATIKINSLNSVNPTEMIDLKAESEKGNPEATKALKSLRGGCCCCRPRTMLA